MRKKKKLCQQSPEADELCKALDYYANQADKAFKRVEKAEALGDTHGMWIAALEHQIAKERFQELFSLARPPEHLRQQNH